VTDAVAAAWLEVLGALVADAAHAVNNVLNSASVNLSVVANRLSSPKVAEFSAEALAGRTAGFAADAANGLDAASELVQSVVALARPLPVPADPARMVADIIRVASVGRRHETAELGVEVRDPIMPPEVASAVRLAIAAGVRTLVQGERGGTVRWVAREVALARPVGAGPEPIVSPRVMGIIADAGVAVRTEADIVTFSIPDERQH
jgi:hypothetical protein